MPKNMKRTLLVTIALAALGVGTGTLFATDAEPPFRALAQERGSDDVLPKGVVGSPVARHDLGPADTARRVGSYRGRTYYLMHGKDQHVCLVSYKAPESVGAMCPSWRGDGLKTLVASARLEPDGTRTIVVLAPDGYDKLTLREASGRAVGLRVVNNVGFVSASRGGELSLSGAGAAPLSVRLPRTLFP